MDLFRLFTLASAISLALLAATLVLYYQDPGFSQPIMRRQFVEFNYRGQKYELSSITGRLSFDNQPQIRMEAARMESLNKTENEQLAPLGEEYNEIVSQVSELGAPSKEREENQQKLAAIHSRMQALTLRENHLARSLRAAASRPSEHTVRWLTLSVVFSVIPFAWTLRWLLGLTRESRRTARGHCVECGYDLRASPGLCPECGREQRNGDLDGPKAK